MSNSDARCTGRISLVIDQMPQMNLYKIGSTYFITEIPVFGTKSYTLCKTCNFLRIFANNFTFKPITKSLTYFYLHRDFMNSMTLFSRSFYFRKNLSLNRFYEITWFVTAVY